jgi:hypothetical protein
MYMGSRSSEQKGHQMLRRKSWQAEDGRSKGGSAPRRRGLCVGFALAMLLFAATGAAATNVVVGPAGAAAGGGYAHWLAVKERLFFDTPAPGPKVCGTQQGPSGQIAFLIGGGRERHQFACGEPSGRPIYVDGLTNECSTLPGDHNGFGTSAAQLARCAREGFKGLSATAVLDGARVVNYRQLIVTTPVITFHLPAGNPFGIKPQNGRSVAYGEGLLLSGLSTGTHTVRIIEHLPQGSNTVTYTVPVH